MVERAPNPYDFLPQQPAFHLTSDDIAEGGTIAEAHVFNGFGLTGGNSSPHLRWYGAPDNTEGYVVTVLDPDAPTGSGFWHWVVVNLPAHVSELPQDAGSGDDKLPGGFHVRNDYGTRRYDGPAPLAAPKRHRYIFTVHALDEPLEVDADASPAAIGFNLFFHTIARAQLIAEYEVPAS
ncbi:YbhB/YbcL family Raf kinase inhibitor-like protein [Actinocrinis sp.]|uniref:YbhB/YbcL family Raf kinase inhibitor-like protein n=1 Tax=Actinocrinis sp. TaxID=1920516 RepID=UPI002BB5E86E|nr:YbhB/YbcL family Raf kinase inhibitor-like protein [Actinocrinis sp.]HXR69384.1 YbhB/YbcL family Raf kinase inhibitor-like protein [Actinocrinis sp.]